ncbi:hypothetical protein [Actinomadura sp. DC4]|uniref:hypothetical protein n=1 Tax=Actinomadura sp. DC4 TaxID=3055069 RepID=UPI0025B0FD9C|nr:hypothetical protein [Actinomadura sp. DC4]MDN3352825.1 hypothetical protein [Actinomadura sp. DC4]
MTAEPLTPRQVRDALVALGIESPEEVSEQDWPELTGRLLGAAFAQLRREDLSEDLDVATENTRIAAAYQAVTEPLGDPRTVAFESAFAALRHFRLVVGALDVEEPLMTAATQLLQLTAMACGVAFLTPNQVLLSEEERTATAEALKEEIDETFGSLRTLERTAKKMLRPA